MKKVLFIDNDEIYHIFIDLLAKNMKFEVDKYFDSFSAFEALKKNTYDFVLIDNRLGGERGSEVAEKMKEIKPNLAIYIITHYLQDFQPKEIENMQVISKEDFNTVIKRLIDVGEL